MKAIWTPTNGTPATLGNDAQKWGMMVIEDLGGQTEEQVEPLFRSASVARWPRANQAGQVVFTVARSHASRDAAAVYFKGEYARKGQQGTLQLTIESQSLVFALADLNAVKAVEMDGLRWTIRYTFGITTIA